MKRSTFVRSHARAPRKLYLRHETVRALLALTQAELRGVAGGSDSWDSACQAQICPPYMP
jgi:hypothetical protein